MKTQNIPTTEITESTRVQNTPEVDAKRDTSFWHTVLVGGVPGILIGAGTTFGVEAIAKGGDNPADGIEETLQAPQELAAILVAHSVTDDMSFSEAFAAARAEVGPGGAFVWHGNVYGTYRADDPEWQAMTDEQRIEHSQAILAQVHPTPYTPAANEPTIVAVNDNHIVNEVHDDSAGEVDVHIVGVEQDHTDDGTLVTVGYGAVDGQYAEFIDMDGDGEVDTVLIDMNDNNRVDAGEVFDAQGAGITVEDLYAEAQANSNITPDDSLYDGTPDYTNDADTSSYV